MNKQGELITGKLKGIFNPRNLSVERIIDNQNRLHNAVRECTFFNETLDINFMSDWTEDMFESQKGWIEEDFDFAEAAIEYFEL